MQLRSNVPDLQPLGEALRVRSVGITTVGLAIRIAAATTVSFFVAKELSSSSFVLFAPVTTLLVVQASPFATVGASIQRVFGTGLGVLLATIYVQIVPEVNALTFGAAVLVALLVARLLPVSLATQLQIPVAVVFVLALGTSGFRQDVWRVLDVVIGGVVGILAVYAWPGRPDVQGAHHSVDAFAVALEAQLRRIGVEIGTLSAALPDERKHEFTASSRALRGVATSAREEYATALNAVRLHPRARGAAAELDQLGARLAWLSGLAIQVRALGGAADRLYDRPRLEPALSPSIAHALLDDCAELVGLVDRDDPGALAFADGARERIAAALDAVASDRVPVVEVLQSVSLLGRLDLMVDSAVRPLGPADEDADEAQERSEDAAEDEVDTEVAEDAALRPPAEGDR